MSGITVRWLAEDGTAQQGGEECLSLDLGPTRWVWVDVMSPAKDDLTRITQRFDLHPLAIEDALHPQPRSKVDVYPSGMFLVWITPRSREGDGVTIEELDVFIGRDYLVTIHDHACRAIDNIAREAQQTLEGGPDWTLHAIVDQLVDSVLPLVDVVGEQLEDVEERMLDAPRQEDLLGLYRIRRQLLSLHRIVGPERDVIRGVARERDVVSEDAYRYLQDVGDHLARVQDSIETYQDLAGSVMDVYLSAQNNRMNEIMKQLTVVATIFMPLTLLSGIYGMNLLQGMWPAPTAEWSFAAVVGSMVFIAAVMAAYFRKKKWW